MEETYLKIAFVVVFLVTYLFYRYFSNVTYLKYVDTDKIFREVMEK